MSLTVLYRSKKVRFIYNLQKRQLAAAAVLVFGIVFIAGRSTHTESDSRARIAFTQSGLIEQKQNVEQLKQTTQQQLTGMMLKLGEMQSQLQRLNAMGERLAVEAHLSSDEFNFREIPAIGGPAQESADIQIDSSLDILLGMDQFMAQLDDKSKQLEVLESVLLNHHIVDESYLVGRPVKSGWLSSYYGIRKDPFTRMPAMHKGLDFAGKEGDVVVATGAGIVTWAGDRYGYGKLIEIEHGDGLSTRYGHNKELKVKVGDVVTKGQTLALMGSTGRSTGAHVHYEVLSNGKQKDPLPYVSRRARSSG